MGGQLYRRCGRVDSDFALRLQASVCFNSNDSVADLSRGQVSVLVNDRNRVVGACQGVGVRRILGINNQIKLLLL